jgi:hypothetical protein
MRDIRAGAEGRALIGAGKLGELHGDAFMRYECWQCAATPSWMVTEEAGCGGRLFGAGNGRFG